MTSLFSNWNKFSLTLNLTLFIVNFEYISRVVLLLLLLCLIRFMLILIRSNTLFWCLYVIFDQMYRIVFLLASNMFLFFGYRPKLLVEIKGLLLLILLLLYELLSPRSRPIKVIPQAGTHFNPGSQAALRHILFLLKYLGALKLLYDCRFQPCKKLCFFHTKIYKRDQVSVTRFLKRKQFLSLSF